MSRGLSILLLVAAAVLAVAPLVPLAEASIVLSLRVPRVLLAALAGATLAAAGCAYQAMFRNPLAEPYTLGVAGAAAVGAYLALAGFGDLQLLPGFSTVTAGALAGGIGVSVLLWSIAATLRARGHVTLLLAGVALGYVFAAAMLYLHLQSDRSDLDRLLLWAVGSVSAVRGDGRLLGVMPWALVGLAILWWRRRPLDLLLTGDLLAASRGLNVSRERLLLGLAAGTMTAGVVAYCGPLAFVGLVVPHVCRQYLGVGHATLLPAAMVGGAAFLVAIDTLSRSIAPPLPVGVLCNLVGGTFFFAMLLGGKAIDRV